MSVEQQYIDLYSQHSELICNHSTPILNQKRAQAMASFEQLGFPTKALEEYKQTDISTYFEPEYGLNIKRIKSNINPYSEFPCNASDIESKLLYVLNDTVFAGEQPTHTLPEGVIMGSLKEMAIQHPELVGTYYGTLADSTKDGVVAFNTAFVQDGLFLYIPKNVVIEQTLQIVNVLYGHIDTLVNRRLLIVVEEGASAKLLICDHTKSDHRFLATQVIELFVGKNASFDLYEMEESYTDMTRLANCFVTQGENSNLLLNGMTLHNGHTRNRTHVVLAGQHAQAHVFGMAIMDKDQKVDNFTIIDHAVPNCQSNELFKYVLDGASTGVFCGKIIVRKDAQKTAATQNCRTLCATSEARMFTKPQLEIYADDVKCGHGATIGQLNELSLHYMRSRGIPEEEAKLLLKFAFVNEVVHAIRIETLKSRLFGLIEQRFRGEKTQCGGCTACN